MNNCRITFKNYQNSFSVEHRRERERRSLEGVYSEAATSGDLLKTLFLKISHHSQENTEVRKGVLRNFAKFTGKHPCQVSILIKLQACNFIKIGTLAQMFSCEFCEISNDTPGCCFWLSFLIKIQTSKSKDFLKILQKKHKWK